MTARDVIAGLVAEWRAPTPQDECTLYTMGMRAGRHACADRLESTLAQPSGEAVAWLWTLRVEETGYTEHRATVSKYQEGWSPFGYAGKDHAGTVTVQPLYTRAAECHMSDLKQDKGSSTIPTPTTPPAPLGGLTEGDARRYERLIEVLAAERDELARRLTAPRAEGVDLVLVPRTLPDAGIGIVLDYINANIGAIAPSRLWVKLIENLAHPLPRGNYTTEEEGDAYAVGWVDGHDAALTAAAPKLSKSQVKRITALKGSAPAEGGEKPFRTIADGATLDDYRAGLNLGTLTPVDQMALDNVLHDLLEATPSAAEGGPLAPRERHPETAEFAGDGYRWVHSPETSCHGRIDWLRERIAAAPQAEAVAARVLAQLRRELAAGAEGQEYTAYENGRIAEKERLVSLLAEALAQPAGAAVDAPLTAAALIRALESPGVRCVAGFNGSCNAVPNLDRLIAALAPQRSERGE